MRPKTRIAAAIAVVALVSLLAACAAPSNNTANTTNTTAPSNTTTSSAPSTTSTQTTESATGTTTQGAAEGRTIFDTGMAAGAAIKFTDGTSAVKSKGVAACATCHGANGKGGEVGPDITWTAIGSKYPTEASFSNAVTKGLDQSNGSLDTGMPRYEMTQAQIAAVYAYVKTLK